VSNLLLKPVVITVLDPGKPPKPGSPGSPGSPAWDETVDYTSIGVIGWEIIWKDAGNNEHLSIVPPSSPPPSDATIESRTPIFGPVHVHEVIHHPAVPPTPPTPGDPGTPPVIETNYQLGWNASADSIGTIVASGQLQFSVTANAVGVFVGLARHAVINDYAHIPYALYFTNGKVQVYENNDALTSAVAFVDADVFTIRRIGPEVAYYQGSTLLYRSLVPSAPSNLSAVTLMYSGGDTVTNAVIAQTVDTALSGTTAGVGSISVPAPYVRAADADGRGDVVVPVPAAVGSNDGECTVTVPVPKVEGHSPDAAWLHTTVPTPRVHGENPALVPVFGLGQAVVPFLSAWGVIGQNPGANITAPVPTVLGADADGHGRISVPVPQVVGVDATNYNSIYMSLPPLRMLMDIEVLPDYFNLGVRMTLPRLRLQAFGDAIARFQLPSLTLAATVASDYNVAAFTLPKLKLSASIVAGAVANVAMTLRRLTLSAGSGSIANFTLPKLVLAAQGSSGTVAQVSGKLSQLTLAASASVGFVATVSMKLPRLISGGWNTITMTLPRLRLLATNDVSYAVSDAYVTTITNAKKPVTRYTNYPFASIVRFGNDYFGFGPTGVFKLSGADDAGVPIAWSFRFGSSIDMPGRDGAVPDGVRKMNLGAYFSGRFNGTTTLSVSVDDGTTYTYSKITPNNQRDTVRFVPGKGLRGFAWQFGFSGIGAMDLYRAEFLQRSLERKVKHG
jgi:hypothetical protein